MSFITNPIEVRQFNEQYENRTNVRLFSKPLSALDPYDRAIIDVAINNTIIPDTVLPKNIEEALLGSLTRSFAVAESKDYPVFNTKVVVDYLSTRNVIAVSKHENGFLTKETYRIAQTTNNISAEFSPLDKAVYFVEAGRTKSSSSMQYSEDLSTAYTLLFNMVFHLSEPLEDTDIESIIAELDVELNNTEVTLTLSASQQARMYGNIDTSGNLTLNVREIGTPDTFYTRTLQIASLFV